MGSPQGYIDKQFHSLFVVVKSSTLGINLAVAKLGKPMFRIGASATIQDNKVESGTNGWHDHV